MFSLVRESLTDSVKNPLISWCGITWLAQLRIQNRDSDSVPSCSERISLVEQLVIHRHWQLILQLAWTPSQVPEGSLGLIQYVIAASWRNIVCEGMQVVCQCGCDFIIFSFIPSTLSLKQNREGRHQKWLTCLITIKQLTQVAINLLLHRGMYLLGKFPTWQEMFIVLSLMVQNYQFFSAFT